MMTGKSTLLNFLIGEQVFKTGENSNKCETKGISMCITKKFVENVERSVIWLDTQGVGKINERDSYILMLSYLVSDQFFYFFQGKFDSQIENFKYSLAGISIYCAEQNLISELPKINLLQRESEVIDLRAHLKETKFEFQKNNSKENCWIDAFDEENCFCIPSPIDSRSKLIELKTYNKIIEEHKKNPNQKWDNDLNILKKKIYQTKPSKSHGISLFAIWKEAFDNLESDENLETFGESIGQIRLNLWTEKKANEYSKLIEKFSILLPLPLSPKKFIQYHRILVENEIRKKISLLNIGKITKNEMLKIIEMRLKENKERIQKENFEKFTDEKWKNLLKKLKSQLFNSADSFYQEKIKMEKDIKKAFQEEPFYRENYIEESFNKIFTMNILEYIPKSIFGNFFQKKNKVQSEQVENTFHYSSDTSNQPQLLDTQAPQRPSINEPRADISNYEIRRTGGGKMLLLKLCKHLTNYSKKKKKEIIFLVGENLEEQ